MPFDELEAGISSSQPVRLYRFQRGLKKWGFCTADRDLEFDGVVYTAEAISDDGIRRSGEASADMIKITLPSSLAVLAQFRPVPPPMEVAVTILDLQFAEMVTKVRWTGSVSGVNWTDIDRAEISCESLSASMEQTGLRMGYGRGCPYTLYDHRCLASKAAKRVTATVTDVGTLTVTSAAFVGFVDGYFSGGFIEWVVDGDTHQRGVESHAGGVLTLLDVVTGLSVGTEVAAYPGCNRTIDICDSRFGNRLNFGGIPALPGKSPFAGDPIY